MDIDGAVDMASTLAVGGLVTVTGNVDASGTFLAGSSDSIFAENNLAFKSSGAAYIDHHTVDADIIFRTSDASALDTTALTLDGSAAGAATFNSSITATSLDISGDIDVDGTANLDIVDIDGAVSMASTLTWTNVAGANKAFLNSGTTTTGANYVNINSTGGAYYLGAENSAGSELGASAYDFVMQAPTAQAVNLMVGAGRARLTSTGLAVTGTITAAGNTVSCQVLESSASDISSGENNGIRLISTSGSGTSWHMTTGTTLVDNSTFTIRDGTNNVNALRITAATGAARFINKVTATELDISGNAAVSGTLKIGGYSYIGEDLVDTDSLDIVSDISENIIFSGYNTGTSTYSERMRIDSSGQVGINCTPSGANLNIKGNASNYAVLKLETGSDSHGSIIEFGDSTDDNYGEIVSYASGAGEGGRMKFTAGAIETMNLRGGSVGIGTASPAMTLDVRGNVNVTADAARILVEEADGTDIAYLGDLTGAGVGGLFLYNHGGTATVQLRAESASTIGNGLIVSKGGSTAAQGDTDLLVRHNSATSTTAQVQILAGNAGYSNLYLSDTDAYNVGGFIYNHSSNYLATNVNGAEKMRIHSSGGVSVNSTTDPGAGVLAADKFKLNGGGGASGFGALDVSTSALAITAVNDYGELTIVSGNSSGNIFSDLVYWATTMGATVITGGSVSGGPASRTYTVAGSTLKLAMASGTYAVSTTSLVGTL